VVGGPCAPEMGTDPEQSGSGVWIQFSGKTGSDMYGMVNIEYKVHVYKYLQIHRLIIFNS